MKVLGRHALVDAYECDPELLNDFEYVKSFLHDVTKRMNLTVVQSVFHRFSPQGVSGVIVISESHLSVHTWPEHGYAAFDLYSCDEHTPLDRFPAMLKEGLKANRVEMRKHPRGRVPEAETHLEQAS